MSEWETECLQCGKDKASTISLLATQFLATLMLSKTKIILKISKDFGLSSTTHTASRIDKQLDMSSMQIVIQRKFPWWLHNQKQTTSDLF